MTADATPGADETAADGTDGVASSSGRTGDGPPAYDISPELPVYRCERCGRPFARESWLSLHRGLDHPADLTDAEVEAYREAYADEQAAIRRFRLKALGALIVLYFGLLMVYALV